MSEASPLPAMTVHPFGTIEGETRRRPLQWPRLRSLARRTMLPALCLAAGLAGLAGIALISLG